MTYPKIELVLAITPLTTMPKICMYLSKDQQTIFENEE